VIIGAALPIAGVDLGIDSGEAWVAFGVLSAVAVMDVALARFATLPGMRRAGAALQTAEVTGYSMIDSTGFLAVLVGLATGVPEAPLVPGAIGLYGWYVVRQYLAGWPVVAETSDA
jgi:hypothetical protein